MTDIPPFTSVLAALAPATPFVGPEAIVRRTGIALRARIGANENPFGPAPQAIAAMAEAAAASCAYGDPELFDLKQAIARHLGIGPQHIAVGEGIDGLFGLALRLFLEQGQGVATSEGAYPTFNFHVAALGGILHKIPYVADREDPQSLLDLARHSGARIMYFANPDNPMGTCWPAAEVRRLIEKVPEGSLLMLDEAYGEFAPQDTLPALQPDDPRVLRFRTFSKAYGLAGARVGYAIGHPEIISAFDKIRNHFGVTRMSQAGALAALEDQDHLKRSVAAVQAARERLYAIAWDNDLQPLVSATNFVAMDTGRDGVFAKRLVDGLAARGIFIRMPGVAPLNRCIRVSAGLPRDLDILAEVLPVVLQDINSRDRSGSRRQIERPAEI